jgi:hypothetical protein
MSKPTAKNMREGSVIWDDDLPADSWWVLRKGKWTTETGEITENTAKPGRFDLGAYLWVQDDNHGIWHLYDSRGTVLRAALVLKEPTPEPDDRLF